MPGSQYNQLKNFNEQTEQTSPHRGKKMEGQYLLPTEYIQSASLPP